MDTMEATALVIKGRVINEDRRMPDNAAYTNRFQIKSESSGSLYTVAQSKSGKWWSCGCRGWIRHKKCKHLEQLGLPFYQQPMLLPKPAGSR